MFIGAHMKKMLITVFCFLTIYAQAQPAQVILIRHAEQAKSGEELSIKGKERAAALAPYFLWTEEYMRFGAPIALFAVNTSTEDRCFCSQQTLAPIAYYLNSTVQHPVVDKEFRLLAEGILKDPNYINRTVIVSWNHTFIPQFAHVLGAESVPASWPEDVYDRVWLITLQEKGPAELKIIDQSLMYGDAPQNLPTRFEKSRTNFQRPNPNAGTTSEMPKVVFDGPGHHMDQSQLDREFPKTKLEGPNVDFSEARRGLDELLQADFNEAGQGQETSRKNNDGSNTYQETSRKNYEGSNTYQETPGTYFESSNTYYPNEPNCK